MNQLIGSSVIQFRTPSGLMWQPGLSRLEVMAEAPEADAGEFAARIFELLPHTPLRGVGNNFAYDVPESAGAGMLERLRSPMASLLVSDRHKDLSQQVTVALTHGDDCVLRVTAESDGKGVSQVSFNFHRDVVTAEAAADAARRWRTDELEAETLLLHLGEGIA